MTTRKSRKTKKTPVSIGAVKATYEYSEYPTSPRTILATFSMSRRDELRHELDRLRASKAQPAEVEPEKRVRCIRTENPDHMGNVDRIRRCADGSFELVMTDGTIGRDECYWTEDMFQLQLGQGLYVEVPDAPLAPHKAQPSPPEQIGTAQPTKARTLSSELLGTTFAQPETAEGVDAPCEHQYMGRPSLCAKCGYWNPVQGSDTPQPAAATPSGRKEGVVERIASTTAAAGNVAPATPSSSPSGETILPWPDAQIDELAALKRDWNSYGAPPIDPKVIAALRVILKERPSLVPGGDGGVRLEWHTKGLDIEVMIDANLISDPKDAGTGEAEPVLCYINGAFAYFTTQALSEQWGDDWNDAPYEHNAGQPYTPHKPGENWRITRVAFDGPLYPPSEGVLNSAYSVQDINGGAVAWLRTKWTDKSVSIPAGVTVSRFRELVAEAGGTVYMPTPSPEKKPEGSGAKGGAA